MTLIGAPITGAHFNPAVSIAVYLTRGEYSKNIRMLLVMIIAQVFGAFLGISLVWNLEFNRHYLGSQALTRAMTFDNKFFYMLPDAPTVTKANAFVIEMICTTMFVILYTHVGIGKGKHMREIFLPSLAVCLTYFGLLCSSQHKTGGCLNPAIGLAQTVWGMIVYGKTPTTFIDGSDTFSSFLWVYTVGPAAGAFLGTFLHWAHDSATNKVFKTSA